MNEWKKEMMKWKKSEIIDLLAKVINERKKSTEVSEPHPEKSEKALLKLRV